MRQLSLFDDMPVPQTATRVLPPDSTGMDLDEAKSLLESHLQKGMRCPCCNQFAKIYRYRFSQNICRYLMVLYRVRRESDRFVHVTELLGIDPMITASRDFLRPAFYGLIEEAAINDPEKKKRSGLWRLTEKGVAFCEKRIAIPKYVVIYNNDVIGYEGELMHIDDFNGDFFSYAELMAR